MFTPSIPRPVRFSIWSRCALIATSLMLASPLAAEPIGNGFTYQGRLSIGGAPANGTYDLRFSLYDVSTGGGTIGGFITNSAVTIRDGTINTIILSETPRFDGTAYWLDIAVRTNDAAADWVPLNPRQRLTPTPYALYAPNAGTSLLASNVAANAINASSIQDGSINTIKISEGAVVKSLSGLRDDVSLLSGANVTIAPEGNALRISASNSAWGLTGNAGTTAANFIGTTDNQPVELRINGERALKLSSSFPGTVNVLAGSPSNSIDGDRIAATISGGGYPNLANRVASDFGTVGGGSANRISTNSNNGVISGGYGNVILELSSEGTIAGGSLNIIGPATSLATIGGGQENSIGTNAHNTTVAGGYRNRIDQNTYASHIGGGFTNRVATNATYATISGGRQNTVGSFAQSATIAGGRSNVVTGIEPVVSGGFFNFATNNHATVAGGLRNVAGGPGSTVGGGNGNRAYGNDTTIAGGIFNETTGANASIGGGYLNNAAFAAAAAGGWGNSATGAYSAIPGGYQNSAAGTMSFAGGMRAKAMHSGSFIWADYFDADFASTADHQFSVRARGGVRLETFGAGLRVDGVSVPTGLIDTAEIADGSVTSMKLDEFLSLGSPTQSGHIGVKSLAGIERASFNGDFGEIILSSATGAQKVGLSASSTFGFLSLFDATGDNSVYLSATDNSGGLISLRNSDGNERMLLSTGPTNGSSSVRLLNRSGSIAAQLLGDVSGHGQLVLRDTNGAPRITLGGQNYGSLLMVDPTTSTTVQLLAGNDTGGQLELARNNAGSGISLTAGTTATGSRIAGRNRSGTVTVDLDGDVSGHGALFLNDTNGSPRIYAFADLGGMARLGVGRSPVVNALEINGDASKTVASAWLANSDRRIKEQIRPLTNALETISRVRPVAFRYSEDFRREHPSVENIDYFNVVAQEFAEVFPNSVKRGGDKLESGESVLQVDTYPATIYSIAAVQELNEKLKVKDAEVKQLSNELNALRETVAALVKKQQ